jgi:hypothetical protein
MYQRLISIIACVFICKVSVCQTLDENSKNTVTTESQLTFFNADQLISYQDSLKKLFQSELLTGCFITSLNEIAGKVGFICIINDSLQIQINTDSLGYFYLIPPGLLPATIRIKVSDKNYFDFDTTLSWESTASLPILIKLIPRYKILLKGRIFVGSLPVEDANVEIIHLSDTFRTKTLSCYIDNENYRNCLYLGMFKQSIIFNNPTDSIFISIKKAGFKTNNISMRCCDYNGNIIDLKLKYDLLLPKLNRMNISFKVTPPFFDNWLVSLGYYQTLKTKNNKFNLGLEGSMLVSNISTQFETFRDITNKSDSIYQISTVDSSYLSTTIGPTIYYYFNNPLRRNFGIYAGLAVPFCFQSKKLSIQPYAGSRFLLDLNKALTVEVRYISYNLNVTRYNFNPYGNASYYIKNETFNKLILNIGLQVYF